MQSTWFIGVDTTGLNHSEDLPKRFIRPTRFGTWRTESLRLLGAIVKKGRRVMGLYYARIGISRRTYIALPSSTPPPTAVAHVVAAAGYGTLRSCAQSRTRGSPAKHLVMSEIRTFFHKWVGGTLEDLLPASTSGST